MHLSNRWIKQGVAALLAVSLLAGQSVFAESAAKEESLKIASLSDTHYLSPDLIKDTSDFTEHLNSDRKMFAESDAFLTALLDTVKQDDPDVLLISGDLTKDGEKEGHEALAEILEKFEAETDTQVYITPGNHDLNNSNAMNFNTPDGVAVPAGRTSPEDYKEIYAELVYNDDSVIATFTPAAGKQSGGLSYVARPKDGFTIISIDSARYSADNTDSGTDEHETSGAVSAELEAWVVEQITAAKQRGDTVIGLQHHGMVPHFSMEPDLLPMYLVNDYERLAQVYADAGMSYIFTGHMHANDIAAVTTEAGNTLYDIETGSVVTYPSPARAVTLTRTIENGTVKESMDVRTYTGVGPITFTNPVTGEEQTIEDITEYGRAHGFSNDMLTTTVNGFLHGYYEQILAEGGASGLLVNLASEMIGIEFSNLDHLIDTGIPYLLPKEDGASVYYDSTEGGIVIDTEISGLAIKLLIPTTGLKQTLNVLLDKLDAELADPAGLDAEIKKLIENLTATPVADDNGTQKTLLDYANFIYQSHLGGEDSGAQPAWVTETAAMIEDGTLLKQIIDTLVRDVADLIDRLLNSLSFEQVLGITAWDYNEEVQDFIAAEGRTPLLRPLDRNTAITLNLLVSAAGAKWTADPADPDILRLPEGANAEIGYTLGEFLQGVKDGLLTGAFLGDFDIASLLDELLNGTPANEEEGTPATEGLLTDELKGQLNGWLLNLVTSMGADSNHVEDNDTMISNEWNLLTDRAALDAAIAKAEALDLRQYTDATAKAVTDALAAANALSPTATQAEIDAAVQALEEAIAALENTTTPGTGDNGNGNTPDVPQTGFDSAISAMLAAALLAGGALTICLVRRRRTSVR